MYVYWFIVKDMNDWQKKRGIGKVQKGPKYKCLEPHGVGM